MNAYLNKYIGNTPSTAGTHRLLGQPPNPPGSGFFCGLREPAQSWDAHLQVRDEVRGRARRGCTLLMSCTVSCLQIKGIIQFPGLLTFSLGINCDHPSKYRQITLKTYIYEAHLFKTFSNSEKYLYLTKRKKRKQGQVKAAHIHFCP